MLITTTALARYDPMMAQWVKRSKFSSECELIIA